MKDLDHLDLETLITLAERLAKQTQDGHLTILRFTTEWKCALGTPSFYSSDGRSEVADLPGFATLREALTHLIIHDQGIDSVPGIN